MSEEKKEEQAAQKQEAVPAAPAAAEAPKAAEQPQTQTDKGAPEAQPKEAATPQPNAGLPGSGAATPQAKPDEQKEAPKKEKPSSCAECKKSIKRKRWYYRNGKYYCTKRCFTQATEKAEKKEGAAPAA